MTNEQAIAELQKEHDLIQGERDLDGSQFAPALLEALAMAIEVMKCSEIPNGSGKDTNVPSNDTISRQAAIDAIHEDADWLAAQGSDWQVERMERDKSILKSLPSAEPEREKGKWIVNETLINCSVCKHSAWSRHAFEDIVRGFNFCPNCGKPMKRGKQDER